MGRAPCRPRQRCPRRLGSTRMRRTPVLDGADHAQPRVPRQGGPGQRPAAARQWRKAFPACRVASLPRRRLAHAGSWRPAAARLHAGRGASHQAAFRLDALAPRGARDAWGDQPVRPRTPPGASACPRLPGIAQGLPSGAAVGPPALGTPPPGRTDRPASHAHHQPLAQGPVPLRADRPASPPARLALRASARPTRPPCGFPRISSACTGPRARAGSTRHACPAWLGRPERAPQAAPGRASHPKAAMSAGTGPPGARPGTTRPTVSAEGRNRETTVPWVALTVLRPCVPMTRLAWRAWMPR